MTLKASLTLVLAGALAVPVLAQEEKSFQTDYYPLKVGHKWTYRTDNKSQVVVQVEERKPATLDYKETATGKTAKTTIATYVLKITSGDKVMTEQVGVLAAGHYRFQAGAKEIGMPGGVYRFQAAGKELMPPECFLKLPLMKDESWEVSSESEQATIKGSFVGGEALWKTPSGAVPVKTVTSKNMQIGTQPLEVEYWFAPKIGIVFQRVHVGSYKTRLELEKFEPAK